MITRRGYATETMRDSTKPHPCGLQHPAPAAQSSFIPVVSKWIRPGLLGSSLDRAGEAADHTALGEQEERERRDHGHAVKARTVAVSWVCSDWNIATPSRSVKLQERHAPDAQ